MQLCNNRREHNLHAKGGGLTINFRFHEAAGSHSMRNEFQSDRYRAQWILIRVYFNRGTIKKSGSRARGGMGMKGDREKTIYAAKEEEQHAAVLHNRLPLPNFSGIIAASFN